MKSWRLPFLALGVLSLFGKACALKSSGEAIPADWQQASYIERGNYLVNHLGHCVGCHTPLGPDGRSDMSLYLSGVPAKFAGAKAGPPQVAGGYRRAIARPASRVRINRIHAAAGAASVAAMRPG